MRAPPTGSDWHIQIDGSWFPVEIIGRTKSHVVIRVPAWERAFSDFRPWHVKQRHLKVIRKESTNENPREHE